MAFVTFEIGIATASSRRLSLPVKRNYVITSGYGYRWHPVYGKNVLHAGIDFAAPIGTPVYAAGPGQVIYAGYYGGYGYTVIIQHPRPSKTLYAHLNQINVWSGQHVETGTPIGQVGNTGLSTGPHLHFEYWTKSNNSWYLKDPAAHLAW